MRHGADAHARRVVSADLRADVALRVEGEHLDRPVRPTHVDELVELDPRLVVVRDDHDPRVDGVDARLERDGHLAPPVERAGTGAVAQLEPLARDAVGLGLVPRHEGFPHVIVRLVAVLVVRRIEVGEVERSERGRELDGIAPHRDPRTGQEIGVGAT